MKTKTYNMCLYGMLGSLTFALKFAMAALPNIEPVSLLMILYTITFGKSVLYPLTVYVILEIFTYGFSFWSIGYLYIWLILVIIVNLIFKCTHSTNALFWACISGAYGLLFGSLYIPLYLISGGAMFALSWWMSGIPYDIMHGIANFVLCFILFKPLMKVLHMLNTKQYKIIGG